MTHELFGAAFALLASGVAGIIAHELSHALALSTLGVSYRIDWAPARDDGLLSMVFFGKLASVTPQAFPATRAPLRLKIASMMPLTLLLPLAGIPLGVLPDPFATGNLTLQVALIGWMACAIPSPQDFSVLWYARCVVRRQKNETA
ncbi:hypothetical protein [Haladaptatus sp. DJG-WS-42]|uniref:hypothetical protein n=1 Tax=Haladaptatus sp. DJG-WS-42 TaxID=3120516 RepID=UPI0030D33051